MTLKEQIKSERRWLEKCILIQNYHNEQVKAHGQKRPNKWRCEDTARELEMSVGYISESLHLAQCKDAHHLEVVSNRDAALKMIRRGNFN